MSSATSSTSSKEAAALQPVDPSLLPQHPARIILAGPSGSGKTEILYDLLMRQEHPWREVLLFAPKATIGQPAYKKMAEECEKLPKKRRFELITHEGLPDKDMQDGIEEMCMQDPKPRLIIMDDLFKEAAKSKWFENLYTSGRHAGLSVAALQQSIFPPGGKTARSNSEYLCIWNFPAAMDSISALARQLEPGKTAQFMDRYKHATSKPHRPLIIDLQCSIKGKPHLKYRQAWDELLDCSA